MNRVIAILLRFEEQHCEWEVAVVVAVEFVDCLNFIDDVAQNVVKHFEVAEAIGASIEFKG